MTSIASKYVIRTVQTEEDVLLYRELFLQSEVLIHLGKELGDENMTAIGTEYVKKQFEEDLQSLASIQKVYKSGGGEFWILYDTEKNVMVGSVALQMHAQGEGELRRMCILPAYRRQGLGKHLLQHFFKCMQDPSAKQKLYKDGACRVILSTPAVNSPALDLYALFGFEVKEKFTVVCDPDESTLELVQLAVILTDSELCTI